MSVMWISLIIEGVNNYLSRYVFELMNKGIGRIVIDNVKLY